jgi:hypothetical protein
MSTYGWRKSRYSGQSANCVEVAPAEGGVLVRDTKDRGTGPVITFTTAEWTAFLQDVRHSTAHGAVTIEAVGTATHLHSASGTTLRFTAGEWAAFRAGVRDGEFDLATLG